MTNKELEPLRKQAAIAVIKAKKNHEEALKMATLLGLNATNLQHIYWTDHNGRLHVIDTEAA